MHSVQRERTYTDDCPLPQYLSHLLYLTQYPLSHLQDQCLSFRSLPKAPVSLDWWLKGHSLWTGISFLSELNGSPLSSRVAGFRSPDKRSKMGCKPGGTLIQLKISHCNNNHKLDATRNSRMRNQLLRVLALPLHWMSRF